MGPGAEEPHQLLHLDSVNVLLDPFELGRGVLWPHAQVLFVASVVSERVCGAAGDGDRHSGPLFACEWRSNEKMEQHRMDSEAKRHQPGVICRDERGAMKRRRRKISQTARGRGGTGRQGVRGGMAFCVGGLKMQEREVPAGDPPSA